MTEHTPTAAPDTPSTPVGSATAARAAGNAFTLSAASRLTKTGAAAAALTVPWLAYYQEQTLTNGAAAATLDLLVAVAFIGITLTNRDDDPPATVHPLPTDDGPGPTDAELAAIEAEAPLLDAELAAVNAQCAYLLAPNDLTERQWLKAELAAETLRNAPTQIGA